jgi:hypothetical protein
MTNQLLFKVPVGTVANTDLTDLLHTLMALAHEYDLAFVAATGECVSPISVRADMSLENAEGVKQQALAAVRKWESRGTK